eukprot:scaffold3273_cov244-Pinguiococcus_pyrenoidosus.AAC.4
MEKMMQWRDLDLGIEEASGMRLSCWRMARLLLRAVQRVKRERAWSSSPRVVRVSSPIFHLACPSRVQDASGKLSLADSQPLTPVCFAVLEPEDVLQRVPRGVAGQERREDEAAHGRSQAGDGRRQSAHPLAAHAESVAEGERIQRQTEYRGAAGVPAGLHGLRAGLQAGAEHLRAALPQDVRRHPAERQSALRGDHGEQRAGGPVGGGGSGVLPHRAEGGQRADGRPDQVRVHPRRDQPGAHPLHCEPPGRRR